MRGIFIGILILVTLGVIQVHDGHAWLIFHKPEYRGKIIDAETKKPLEGVVVVAVYSTSDVIGGPGGPLSRDIDAREALTDENGIFVIPAYTTIMNPIAREDPTGFIIFKPGYSGTGGGKMLPFAQCRNLDPYYFPPQCHLRVLFTKPIGSREEIIKNPRTRETITITNGIVELTRLDTLEERRDAVIAVRPDFNLPIFYKKNSFELPIIFKMIAEEDCFLSFQQCSQDHTKKNECKKEYKRCMYRNLKEDWWNMPRLSFDDLVDEARSAAENVQEEVKVVQAVTELHTAPEPIVICPTKSVRKDTLTAEELEKMKNTGMFGRRGLSDRHDAIPEK